MFISFFRFKRLGGFMALLHRKWVKFPASMHWYRCSRIFSVSKVVWCVNKHFLRWQNSVKNACAHSTIYTIGLLLYPWRSYFEMRGFCIRPVQLIKLNLKAFWKWLGELSYTNTAVGSGHMEGSQWSFPLWWACPEMPLAAFNLRAISSIRHQQSVL